MDTSATDKPLRADARRNREKVVTAALEAFAEHGPDAQMDDIARRAGVGVGTLYRHFPTKDALVRAIIAAQMEENAAIGRELLDQGGDPWEAFATFVRRAGMKDHSVAEVVTNQPREAFLAAAGETGVFDVAEQLLTRAQDAGAIRPDVRITDVPLIFCGLGAVLRQWDQASGRRYVELILQGFRTGADPEPLP